MEDTTNSELTTATLSGNLDELLCIEYPGKRIFNLNCLKISVYCFIYQANVQNVDRAVDTLGGEMNITRVCILYVASYSHNVLMETFAGTL